MNVFLVDLTHGGVKISVELAKSGNYEKIYAYDIYNTLKTPDEDLLKNYEIKIIKSLDGLKKAIKSNYQDLEKGIDSKSTEGNPLEKDLIINPIHSSLNVQNLLNEIADELKIENKDFLDNFSLLNHHEATELVLSDWKNEIQTENIPCIELTGVKGKTSTVFLLKEIFEEYNKDTLLLSSLGAHLFRNHKDTILMKDISITPANIINTIQMAGKIHNPKCGMPNDKNTDKDPAILENKNANNETAILENKNANNKKFNYEIAIFENSLGITGLGDIGILTNIIENYPIAKGQSNAREAKRQIFKSPIVVIEKESLENDYKAESEEFKEKINSFSIEDETSNLFVEDIDYDLDKSRIKIRYHDLKTLNITDGRINENTLDGTINIETFAPGKHHVLNALASITTALSLGIDEKTIQKGLSNYRGIDGRTSQKKVKNSRIIEEINPGINTKAVESSINMIKDINNYHIIIGGKYGVTCEEIDENKLSSFLNSHMEANPETKIILTDELGLNIKKQLDKLNNGKYQVEFVEDYKKAQETAINENKNILFIYRSNYSQVSKR